MYHQTSQFIPFELTQTVACFGLPVPYPPVTNSVPFQLTDLKNVVTPTERSVHVIPSGLVKIDPVIPVATNNPLPYATSDNEVLLPESNILGVDIGVHDTPSSVLRNTIACGLPSPENEGLAVQLEPTDTQTPLPL
jgi:hypothetical protein